jgi:type VI secretion system protein ImpK
MNQITAVPAADAFLQEQNRERYVGSLALEAMEPRRAHVGYSEPPFSFGLRGGTLNPLIDSSSPLMALILRIFSLGDFDDIDDLHKRCKHEIESVELELHRLGFERVTIMAHRYCLCSVIDETVMCSPWGQDSNWSERSLLATFHDETWGGEKYFVILERLMMEPSRYLQIIEFLYICMCLGYEGKYRVMHNGRSQLEALIKEVHDVIRKERGHPDPLSTLKADFIVDKAHHISWQTPLVAVFGVTLLLMAALYAGYFYYTETYATGVIAELTKVLGK